MMEPRLKFKNRTEDRWRRLGYEILSNSFQLILTHGTTALGRPTPIWHYQFRCMEQ